MKVLTLLFVLTLPVVSWGNISMYANGQACLSLYTSGSGSGGNGGGGGGNKRWQAENRAINKMVEGTGPVVDAGSATIMDAEWDDQGDHYDSVNDGSATVINGEWDDQGNHYAPAGGGNAWRSDGTFMQKAAGGYIDTSNGQFVPAN